MTWLHREPSWPTRCMYIISLTEGPYNNTTAPFDKPRSQTYPNAFSNPESLQREKEGKYFPSECHVMGWWGCDPPGDQGPYSFLWTPDKLHGWRALSVGGQGDGKTSMSISTDGTLFFYVCWGYGSQWVRVRGDIKLQVTIGIKCEICLYACNGRDVFVHYIHTQKHKSCASRPPRHKQSVKRVKLNCVYLFSIALL